VARIRLTAMLPADDVLDIVIAPVGGDRMTDNLRS
jgi:hypothetical protein